MKHISPFDNIHKNFNAVFADYHGWQLPSHYGDIAVESEKLYNNCAAFDLSSFGRIKISGKDQGKLIEILLANNTGKLSCETWIWGICCDRNGRLADIVRVMKNVDSIMIFTTPPKREVILSLVQQCIKDLILDAEANDITESTAVIGLYGPNSMRIAKEMLPINIDGLEQNCCKQISVFMMNATIIGGSWLGLDGVEILCGSSMAAMAGMALSRFEDEGLVQPAGMECLNTAFIESSVPLSVDDRPKRIDIDPVSAGLGKFIDFDKDFLGKEKLQESIANDTAKVIMGLKISALNKIHRDMDLQYDDGKIGWVDTAAYSHREKTGLAIAFVDRNFAGITEEVQISSNHLVAGAELTELPFEPDILNRIYSN